MYNFHILYDYLYNYFVILYNYLIILYNYLIILYNYFLGTTGALMVLAFFVDIIVWVKAGKIQIDDCDNDEEKAEKVPLEEPLQAIASKEHVTENDNEENK